MLSLGLTKTLLERRIISSETNVDVEYTETGTFGTCTKVETFFVDNFKVHEDYVEFSVRNFDGKCLTVTNDQILAVDGMLPKVVAAAFDLQIDGSKKKLGKRRGRPRKHPLPKPSWA